jgi:hypothetical protein
MYDDENLSHYNCPHMSDRRYKSYSDMMLSESNALGSFKDAKGKVIPRGAHPVKSFSIVKRPDGAPLPNAPVTQANTEAEVITALTSGDRGDSWVITMVFETTEPILFMSPLLMGSENNNNAGLYGVKNFDFVFNLDTSAKRLFCTNKNNLNITLNRIISAKLNLNYLSVQASDLLASKNVLPYTDYARHLTTFNSDIASGATGEIVAQSIQLNQIPNRIYIVARKPMNTQTISDSNSFLAIQKIAINFNNVAGILSGATVEDLYNISKANGSHQDYYEFRGEASFTNGVKKSTIGSILVLDPSRDMNLPDYLSNGSIGQFSFQANVTVKNTEGENVRPELMVIAEYNGMFITQAGQSMKQTGLLTTDLVMSSTMAQFGESSEYVKSFGSGNGGNINSSLRNIPYLNMKKSGGAKSGGAFSGGSSLQNLV